MISLSWREGLSPQWGSSPLHKAASLNWGSCTSRLRPTTTKTTKKNLYPIALPDRDIQEARQPLRNTILAMQCNSMQCTFRERPTTTKTTKKNLNPRSQSVCLHPRALPRRHRTVGALSKGGLKLASSVALTQRPYGIRDPPITIEGAFVVA